MISGSSELCQRYFLVTRNTGMLVQDRDMLSRFCRDVIKDARFSRAHGAQSGWLASWSNLSTLPCD